MSSDEVVDAVDAPRGMPASAAVAASMNAMSVIGGGESEPRSLLLPRDVTRHCGGLLWNADLLAGVGATIAPTD